MPLIIADGTGNSFTAKVDDENRLRVKSTTEPEEMEINEEKGTAWSLPFETITTTAIDAYFFYFKNTSSSVRYHITDIRISVGNVASQIELHRVTGIPTAGTDITEVPKNTSSTNIINGVFQTDIGAGFTGLTNAGILYFIQCPVVATQYHLKTSSNVIIQPGTAVALLCEAINTPAGITGIISIVEHLND